MFAATLFPKKPWSPSAVRVCVVTYRVCIEAMLEAKDFYFGALAQVRMESWSKGRITS